MLELQHISYSVIDENNEIKEILKEIDIFIIFVIDFGYELTL